MRAITSGVKVVGGLLGRRVCLLLFIVFFCAIDRSSTIGTLTDEQGRSAVTIELNFEGIDRKNRTAVAIVYREARRKILESLNRRRKVATAVSPTYSTTTASKTTAAATTNAASTIDPATTNAATTINPTTTTSTTPSTTTATTTITTTPTTTASVTTITSSSTFASTLATTPTTTATTPPTTSTTTAAALTTTPTTPVVTTTAETFTTASTTPSGLPPISKKRKRRNSGGNNDTFTEEDLPFVDNDPEIDENGNLRITTFIYKEEFGDLDLDELFRELEALVDSDLDELFHEVAKAMDKSGELESSVDSPRIRVNIYKGLPKELTPGEKSQLSLNFWLPVLLASSALLLISIFIFVRFWSSRNKKTGDTLDREKFIPVLMG